MSMKQIQHMLFQYFYSYFAIHFLFFGQEVKARPRPTHFTRKSYPNHDQIWILTVGTLNLGSNRSDDGGTTRNT